MILRSGNLGDTWELVRKFDKTPLRGVFGNPDDSRNVILAVGGYQKTEVVTAIETVDGGATWKTLVALPRDGCDANSVIRAVEQVRSQTGRTLFVGGCHGLQKSSDEGKSWVTVGGIK